MVIRIIRQIRQVFDAHCHLTYPGLREKIPEIIVESSSVLTGIATCGLPFDREKKDNFEDARTTLKLSQEFEGFVFVSLGLHPTQVVELTDSEIELYKSFLYENRDRIVAVGEIGLDKFWIKSEDEYKRSEKAFIEMLELAEKIKKPIVIHSRKAEEEAVEILSSYKVEERVLMHSFTGNMTTAKRALDMGFYFSVNYKVTNSKNMRKIAKNFPLESILTETDAPFLAPEGGINTPLGVKAVVEEIAKLRGKPFEEIDKITTQNALKFYNIEARRV